MMTMESVKARSPRAAAKSSGEYRRVEEEEELDEAEWGRRTEARSRGRKRAERYVFTCALFASLNAILLGYGSSLNPTESHRDTAVRCLNSELTQSS